LIVLNLGRLNGQLNDVAKLGIRLNGLRMNFNSFFSFAKSNCGELVAAICFPTALLAKTSYLATLEIFIFY
jgi:hypothetical protein